MVGRGRYDPEFRLLRFIDAIHGTAAASATERLFLPRHEARPADASHGIYLIEKQWTTPLVAAVYNVPKSIAAASARGDSGAPVSALPRNEPVELLYEAAT
jgi:hypothetical protein